MVFQLSTSLRNNMLDQISSSVGASGILKIFTGAAPANVAAADSGTLLVSLTCNATFAPAAAGGILTLNSISSANAVASGSAGYFRLYQSNGTTCVSQGSVGTSGADLNIISTNITNTQPVQIDSWIITAPGA
ncbi:MAG: hypothetical protein ACOYK8_00420 [Alphaproteobacteria bacterium]